MAMLQQIRGHMQTMPEVKSEWLNGLESVLVKKIQNEKRVQPRITNYFSQSSQSSIQPGQSDQSTSTIIGITIQTMKYTSLEFSSVFFEKV